MYLYIGDDILVKTRDIIAIIDKESTESSTIMEKFHNNRKKPHFMKGGIC